MEANISNIGLITSRSPGDANSLRYMAVLTPIGTATANATIVVSIVPTNKGSTPNDLDENNGVHWVPVRNSRIETLSKKGIDCEMRIQMMAKLTAMEISPAIHKNSKIGVSL